MEQPRQIAKPPTVRYLSGHPARGQSARTEEADDHQVTLPSAHLQRRGEASHAECGQETMQPDEKINANVLSQKNQADGRIKKGVLRIRQIRTAHSNVGVPKRKRSVAQ